MNSTRNQIPADELPTRPRFGRKEGAGRSLAVGSLAVRSRVVGLLAVGLLVLAWTASLVPAAAAGIGEASPAAAADETVPEPTQLSVLDAVVLGAVEGVTEFLPISSTGHLFFTERLLGIGDTPSEKAAADSFAIVIQIGAILAVALLYWHRILSILRGFFGKDEQGRQLLIRLLIAFGPAVVVALIAEDAIKEHLFGGWPIVAAWAVGGLAIFAARSRLDDAGGDDPGPGGNKEVSPAVITPQHALLIGAAQAVAMWPGTSRSLITILAAVLLGYSLSTAVEFSFLLGLLTLGAATAYEGLNSGSEIVSSFGVAMPLLGIATAALTAAVSVKWMVGYLQRRSFVVFAYYRLAAAALGATLLIAGVVKSGA